MNDDVEPTDDQIEELLATYAEALYQNSIVPDGEQGLRKSASGMTTMIREPQGTPVEDPKDRKDRVALEVDLQPEAGGNRTARVVAVAGTFVLAAALGVAALVAISNNDTNDRDLAQQETADATEDLGATEEAGTADGNDPSFVEETAGFFDPTASRTTTVFVDSEFVTLSNTGSGFAVTRGIGDNARSTPATGLPENASVRFVVATDSGFAALIEQSTPHTFLLATSPDMVNWTTVELPALRDSDGGELWSNGLAASGDQLAIVGQARSAPGQPPTNAELALETVMWVGPGDGPFEIVDLPIDALDLRIVGTPDGFVIVGSTDEEITRAFASADGLTWNEVESPPGTNPILTFTDLAANENTVVAVTERTPERLTVGVSTDLGQTWTEGSLDSTLVAPAWEFVAGPAGFAVKIVGPTEPVDTGLTEDRPSSSFDEQASELWFSSDGSTWTLVDPGEPDLDSVTGLFGVGDDEVVTFELVDVQPPASAEEQTLDKWYENGRPTVFTAIPAG